VKNAASPLLSYFVFAYLTLSPAAQREALGDTIFSQGRRLEMLCTVTRSGAVLLAIVKDFGVESIGDNIIIKQIAC
jgi:hypothetical protein